jgi:hypothetical protein
MNSTQLAITKTNRSLLTRLCLLTASLALTATSAAATNENIEQDYNKTSTVYVDSIFQWGAWELDIEPAAGGLQAQTTQALTARDSKVRLRTNSMSALAPPQRPESITPPSAPIPIAPPLPVPVPTITPISPRVPVPIGGPGDGF